MSRILFTTTLGSSGWAGSEVLWFQAGSRLASSGYSVAVLLPPHMRTLQNKERLSRSGIISLEGVVDRFRFINQRICRRLRPTSPAVGSAIVRHAKSWRADVVVLSQASCWGAYSEMLALASSGIPYICISQLNTPFSWPGDRTFEAIGEAFALAEASIFVSNGNLDLFQNQIARKLINARVIYNPPSFPVDPPCAPQDVTSPFRLLNVARLDPAQKGQDVLLDVLDQSVWRQREVHLEIAGSGNTRWISSLISAKNLPNVKLLGQVEELRSAWERATFGIFPSRFEGMPLAMIEGMGLGRGMIATDVAGHAEWIENGRNGFLATAPTRAAIDAALEQAWKYREAAKNMGENARSTYKSKMATPPDQLLADVIKESLGESKVGF